MFNQRVLLRRACDACTEYLAQFRRTIELTGTLTLEDVTAEAEAELLAAFLGWKAGTQAHDDSSS